jgi:hypothetical protein
MATPKRTKQVMNKSASIIFFEIQRYFLENPLGKHFQNNLQNDGSIEIDVDQTIGESLTYRTNTLFPEK